MPIGEYVEEQKKVGCSKCRYKGCSKCRGYTLKEAAQRKKGASSDGVLDGIAFMISRDGNFMGTKAQEELSKTIKSMGGRVLASLNDLLKITQTNGNGNRQADAVLVTNLATSRTLKCIGARVVGIPMITPKWVADCKEKNRLGGFTSRTANVLIGKGGIAPPGPLL